MASKGLVGWQDVDLSPEGQAEVPHEVATWAVAALLVL
jgi:bisphosphoglycerate-dependent phosphoglycerate mutase